MPTYQYACTSPECRNEFELVQSFSDPAASQCPVCGGPVRKVFSAVGVVFKGSGFYRNDSRSDRKRASSGADSGSGASGGSSSDSSSGSSTSGSSGSSPSEGSSSNGSAAKKSPSTSGSSGSSSAPAKAAAPA